MKVNTAKMLRLVWLINGILLLGGIAIGVLGLAAELVRGLFRSETQGVEVIETMVPEESSSVEQEILISHAVNLDEYIYLPLSSASLSLEKTGNIRNFKMGSYGLSYPPVINYLVISKETQDSYMLFPSNAFIRETWCADYEYQKKNYFLSVGEDTNGDGRLDEEDSSDLWECEKSGKRLVRIAGNVAGINIVDDENVLIQFSETSPRRGSFMIYNSGTGLSSLIPQEKLR